MDVLIALMPVSVMAVVQFGIKSLVMILLGITSAVLFEFLYQRFTGLHCLEGLELQSLS